jgi:hypothetical protein
MSALDALECDVGGEVDEDFGEKETCLEMLKKFLKDKILTEKDYKYLSKKVDDFYGINLPAFFFNDREGNNPRTVEIITEQLYVKTQMFYHWNDFIFVITGKRF